MRLADSINVQQIVEWRRHLHRHPELGFEEFETSKFIVERLTEMGIEVLRPTETGVVGVIRGAKPGRVVGLRADIDALPVQEETDLPYRSAVDGKMHACGHDCHTASLLGAAQVLAGMREALCGTVKVIFQPAEERTPGGAIGLVESGALDDVEIFFGTHVFPGAPAGVVASRVGPMTAAQDGYVIEVRGKGGHGAMPELAVDPIVVAAELVLALNLIVSRSFGPMENAVITCGRFTAGTASNIIPETARLDLSVRTNTEEGRIKAERRIREVAAGVCAAHGATCEVRMIPGYAAVLNDAAAVDIVRRAAEKHLGENRYVESPLMMGSEDFSAYAKIAPGAFIGVMAGAPEQGYLYNNHHPKFTVDEQALPVATAIYVGCALEAMGLE
ncbi:MAG: amidohydrolase [Clostridiales bacterium]|nr:amidohydrolase [Clostridiales bacterium]